MRQEDELRNALCLPHFIIQFSLISVIKSVLFNGNTDEEISRPRAI